MGATASAGKSIWPMQSCSTELTDLPVNGDFEDGYGDTPEDVAATVEAAIGAGLAGLGIEDTSGIPKSRSAISKMRSSASKRRQRQPKAGSC